LTSGQSLSSSHSTKLKVSAKLLTHKSSPEDEKEKVPVPPGVPLNPLSFCDQPLPEFKIKDAPAALPVI